jgi:hypothetical protein
VISSTVRISCSNWALSGKWFSNVGKLRLEAELFGWSLLTIMDGTL